MSNPRFGLFRKLLSGAALLLALGSFWRPAMAQTPAPLVTFRPGTQSKPFSGFIQPQGVAIDSSGNIYITDPDDGIGPAYVYKETLSNGTYTQSTIGSGFFEPWGVVVDGSGNVYVADFGQFDRGPGDTRISAVYKLTPAGGGSYTQTTISSNFSDLDGIVVDSSGNLYVADYGCALGDCEPAQPGGIYKLTPAGGGTYTQTTLVANLTVSNVALDSSGNLYYTIWPDSSHPSGVVYKRTPSGVTSTVVSGLVTPESVAVTPSGTVYVADDNNLTNGFVYQETPNGDGTYTQSTLINDGVNGPESVVLDKNGNLYIAMVQWSDEFPVDGAGFVYKEDYADPPSLSFANTNVGSTSSAQTVTVNNIGNATLNFAIPGSGNNPNISSGFTLASGGSGQCPLVTSGSTSVGTLAPGASCALTVAFAPQATGSYSGSTLVLTDNNANATAATQTIVLNGTGTGTDIASYFTITGPGSVNAGASTSITVKAYDAHGNLVTGYSGTVHFTSSDPAAVLPANSTLSSGTGTFSLTLKTVGTQTVTATDTSTSSVTGLVGITVNGGTATHLGVSAPSSATAGTPFSVTVLAYDASGNFTNSYNGTVHFSSTDGSASLPANVVLSSGEGNFPATLNTAGSQTITATDTVTSSITGVSSAINVGQAPAITSAASSTFTAGASGTFTVTASGSPAPTFSETGGLPSGVTLSSTGVLSGTPAAGTGGSYPITITASNGVGTNSTQSFILMVSQAPIVTSADSATFTAGKAGTFTVGTIAFPTAALSESGSLPSGVTFTDNGNGTATLSGTPGASTAGPYPFTITAGNGISPNATQSFTLTVDPPPSFVVTTRTDDASGIDTNCPSGGSGLDCSLRDALAAASAVGGAPISFSPTVFAVGNSASQNTIFLSSTLSIPSNTTITGPAARVTVSGGGPASNFSVFTVASGVRGAEINGLTITNGNVINGGGILNNGALTIANSTIAGNTAIGNFGGGIYNTNGAVLTISNSTIAGNSAGFGGGIFIESGSLNMTNSTVSGNTGRDTAGGLFNNGSGPLTIVNSIVAGNTAPDCSGGTSCPANGPNGNVIGGTPNLASLGNYGGPTQTMIPLPGSAAICAINPSSATGTDQRGLPRTTTYGATTCQDSGAVQSNYAISFTTNPAATELSSVAFPAAITLTESGNPFTGAIVSIPVTLSGGATLSGSPVSASTSAGVATYSLTATSATAITGLQLNSTLALNSPATISAQSSSFDLNPLSAPAATASFSPSTIVVGQTSQLTITVTNPNAATLSNVQFNDTLPSGITLVQLTAGTCASAGTGGGAITLDPGAGNFSVTSNTLAANSSCSVTVQVRGDTVTTATDNTSTISSSNAPTGTDATATLTVNPDVTQLAFSTAPAATLTAGGNAGASVTVQEETSSGTLVSTASDALTLTVTGPNSYSKSYTEAAVSGAATFNLSTAALMATGSYSYTASIVASPSVTAATATETVTAGSPASVTVVSGSGQSATIGTAFAAPLKVKVEDSNSNPVAGATVTFTAPSSGASTSLGGSPATTASDGTASVTATANGIAGATAYTVTASVTGATPVGFTLTNTQHTTTLTVTQLPSTPVYGQPVTIAAAIAPATVGTSSPTGTVTFYDSSTTLTPTSAVTGASASYTVSVPTVGSHSYAAQYGGDNNFSQSTLTHAAASLVVDMANSTLSGPTSPVSLTYGAGGTIAIAIAGQYSGPGIATPSGSVSYTIGSGAAQTAAITSGTATLNIPASQTEGTYTIAVSYNGDTNYNAATPINIVLTIGHATLTLTVNNVSKIYGTANPTFTGTVTGQQNGDTFTESFSTTATLSSPVGSYAIVPSATGTNLADYTQSVTNGTLNVTQAAATTTLGVSSASITPGQSETLTARVASTTTGTPSGTVNFYDGTSLLGTVSLSGGVASYSTAALAPGAAHILTATYSGDTNFTASNSTSSASVTVAGLDFTMTISGPSSATVVPGHTITYQIAVTPDYGSYAGTVNFATSGLPLGATATFSPSSIPANGGTQTVTVTIQTAPATALNRAPSTPSSGRRAAPVSLALLALFGLGGLRRRGHALKRLVCIVALLTGGAAATFSLSGCGSSNGFFNQAPQNYTITITATAASLQHSATVMLNVQ